MFIDEGFTSCDKEHLEQDIEIEIQNFEEDNDHPLRVVLRENDLWNWNPDSPIHMLHGEGDLHFGMVLSS